MTSLGNYKIADKQPPGHSRWDSGQGGGFAAVRAAGPPPPGPNSLNKRGVSVAAVSGAPSLCRAIVISGAAPGTTCGNHRANYPRHLGTLPAIVFAGQLHERIA